LPRLLKAVKKTGQSVSQNAHFYVQPTAVSAGSPPVVRHLFEVTLEPHTGARPSVRLCVGLIKAINIYSAPLQIFRVVLFLLQQRRGVAGLGKLQ
jgi:hypothetical protein